MDPAALAQITHGIYILGAADDKRFVGCVVDAVMQASMKPLVIALSCMNTGFTKHVVDKTKRFSLSVVDEAVSPFVIANFGFQTSRLVDKWSNVNYLEKEGLPFLKETLAGFTCRVLSVQPFESHTVYLAEVEDAWLGKDGICLTYQAYQNGFKAQVFSAFQQYLKEKEMTEQKYEWVCTLCGYVYDEETPFEDLPDTWVCPLCGAGKDAFEKRLIQK